MSLKMITACTGKDSCNIFKSPETLLRALEFPFDFSNLMAAIEIVKKWRKVATCPFRVKMSTSGDGENLRKAICSVASKPPFSMDAVSKATGYSKTRVAQIEYTAIRKAKRVLGRSTLETEVLDRS
jgi:hypothetical protein